MFNNWGIFVNEFKTVTIQGWFVIFGGYHWNIDKVMQYYSSSIYMRRIKLESVVEWLNDTTYETFPDVWFPSTFYLNESFWPQTFRIILNHSYVIKGAIKVL